VSNVILVLGIVAILLIVTRSDSPEQPLDEPGLAEYQKEAETTKETTPVTTDLVLNAFEFTDSNDSIQRRRQSINEFKKAMSLEPPFLGDHTQGYAYAKLGQYDKAIELCRQTLQSNPAYSESRYTLAWIYTKLLRYDDAISVCLESIKIDTSYLNSKYLLAWLYSNQGKYEQALEIVKQAGQKAPDSPMVYYGLGRIYGIQKRHQDAIEAYQQALKLKPDYAPVYLYYGISFLVLEKYQQALDNFNQAVFYDPYYEYAHILAGLTNFHLQRYDAAANALQKAVDHRPASAQKPPQISQTSFTPDYSKIHYFLGLAYIKTGQNVQAHFQFEQAVKIKPDFSQAYYTLVLTHLLLDNKEQALQIYKTLENLDKQLADKLTPLLNNE
jgi:tetratricopeptide (TPR) repeat protein